MDKDKITILIVDDEIISRYTIEALLESNDSKEMDNKTDYTLVFAESGAQCLEKIEVIQPDIVLLDVMMPEMNGFSVCKKIRANKEQKDLPIIMMTAWDDPTAKQRCLTVGANDVVGKPFDSQDLHKKIRQVIAAP